MTVCQKLLAKVLEKLKFIFLIVLCHLKKTECSGPRLYATQPIACKLTNCGDHGVHLSYN